MTRSARPTACASNPDTTLIGRIPHPAPVATPSPQTPMTPRALGQRRHHLLARGHVLSDRLLPRPDDRHRGRARLPLPPRRGQSVLSELRHYPADHPYTDTPLTTSRTPPTRYASTLSLTVVHRSLGETISTT